MFKLVLLSALVAVVAAKPGNILLGKLVSEKTIESHGNSVVHSSAPLVAPAVAYASAVPLAQPVVPVAVKSAAVVAEKTVEAHGHSVVHGAPALSYVAPAHLVHPATPVVAKPLEATLYHAAPLTHYAYSPYSAYPAAYAPAYVAALEKTVSSYGHQIVHT